MVLTSFRLSGGQMLYKDTQDLIDAIKPYCSLDTLYISTDNRDWRGKPYQSDLVWILKKHHIGFEVFEDEVRIQYFEDHIHFSQWSEQDTTSHIKEAKETLINIFTLPIIIQEIYIGNKRTRYEYFFIDHEGKRESINGPWILRLFFFRRKKKVIKESTFKYSVQTHDFELINYSTKEG